MEFQECTYLLQREFQFKPASPRARADFFGFSFQQYALFFCPPTANFHPAWSGDERKMARHSPTADLALPESIAESDETESAYGVGTPDPNNLS